MAQVRVLPQTEPLTGVRRRPLQPELVALLLVALVIVLVIYGQRQPQPLSVAAPLDVFAAGRAKELLKKIAEKPHPVGTAAHDAVRDYVLQQLTAMGLEAQVQKTTSINAKLGNPVTAGTVENVIARIPGTVNHHAVLVVAHYDSVPTGPGASDDGSAVAAILETVRALRTGPPLKNDLIVLFTDAEEAGLLGSSAFTSQHPFAKDVSVVLNFEARGSSGPVLMFETSAGNRWLIDEFAQSASYPATTSLLYAIYKLLPNDTDLSVFKQAHLKGLNFAFVEQPTHYHTQLDNLANIDDRSLQQQGSLLLGLTKQLGNAELPAATTQDAVYFDLFNAFVVHYPESWAIPAALAVLLVFAGVVGFGFKKRQLNFLGVALGAVALVLSTALSWLIVSVIWRLVLAVHSEYRLVPWGDTYNSKLYFVSFLALTAAITVAFTALFGRRVRLLDLWVGALTCWLVLSVVTAVMLPGGSYLFTWPLLITLLPLLLTFVPRQETGSFSLKRQLVLLIGAAAGVILFVPVIRVVFAALTISSAGMVMVPVALLLGLFGPQLYLLTRRSRWLLPAALIVISVGFLIAGSLTAGFSDRHPRPDNLFYALDANNGQAVWASTDGQSDAWTSQFFSQQTKTQSLPQFFPLRSNPFRTAAAPVESLPAPAVQLLSDTKTDGLRTLQLKITSARQASVVSLGVESDKEVRGTMLNGQPINIQVPPANANKWGLRYFAVPAEGIELTLEAKSTQPLIVNVVDQTYGLPQLTNYRPRPATSMPAPLPFSDSTFVSRSFTF